MKHQLRHFDYMLAVGTLAAGQQKLVSITLDNDSSFILRSRALHIQSDTPQLAGQANLTSYLDQYTGPDGEYLSQDLVRFSNENATFGQYGSPLPVRPPMIYPPGGAIQANIRNDGVADLDGLEIYFRGQKLFEPGVLPCWTYPEKFATNWYIYNSPRPNFPALTLPVSGKVLDNIVQMQNDSDFALRSIHFGSMAVVDGGQQYSQVWIQLKDWDGRAYSNVPVHVDVCFGALGSLPFTASLVNMPPPSIGPYHPGLATPEIYIPKSRFLWFDLVRDDTFLGLETEPIDVRLAFQGAKVYPL